jgi:hypothetical protein
VTQLLRGLANLNTDPPVLRWVRRICIVVFVLYAVPGLFSAYRAWMQVKSLDVVVARTDLHRGDTLRVYTVSWARTYVTTRLLLVQGSRTDTLALHRLPPNPNASLDPRLRRDTIVTVVGDSLLARYAGGPATLRATAIGGPQWFRTPPPQVREIAVQVRPSP